MLSFNEIAATIRTPGVFVEFDASRALPGPERLEGPPSWFQPSVPLPARSEMVPGEREIIRG